MLLKDGATLALNCNLDVVVFSITLTFNLDIALLRYLAVGLVRRGVYFPVDAVEFREILVALSDNVQVLI